MIVSVNPCVDQPQVCFLKLKVLFSVSNVAQISMSAYNHHVSIHAQTPLDHTLVRATSASVWNQMDVVQVGECSIEFN